jgi:hypothetical protein
MLNACYFALPLFLCLPAAGAATLNVTLDGAKAGARKQLGEKLARLAGAATAGKRGE